MFCGQRMTWQGRVLVIDQDNAIEASRGIKLETHASVMQ